MFFLLITVSCQQIRFLVELKITIGNEKKFKCLENIMKFRRTMKVVNVWGKDWKTFDAKSRSQNILKKKLPFKIIEARILTFDKVKN